LNRGRQVPNIICTEQTVRYLGGGPFRFGSEEWPGAGASRPLASLGLHARGVPTCSPFAPGTACPPCQEVDLTHALGPAGRRDQDTAPVSILEKNRLRCPPIPATFVGSPGSCFESSRSCGHHRAGLQRRRAEHERAVSNRARPRARVRMERILAPTSQQPRCLRVLGPL
jgi:hypothetical protein